MMAPSVNTATSAAEIGSSTRKRDNEARSPSRCPSQSTAAENDIINSPPRHKHRISESSTITFPGQIALDREWIQNIIRLNTTLNPADIQVAYRSILDDPNSHTCLVTFPSPTAASAAALALSAISIAGITGPIEVCPNPEQPPENLADALYDFPTGVFTMPLHCIVTSCAHFCDQGTATFNTMDDLAAHWHEFHPDFLARIKENEEMMSFLGWLPCKRLLCDSVCFDSTSYNKHMATCSAMEGMDPLDVEDGELPSSDEAIPNMELDVDEVQPETAVPQEDVATAQEDVAAAQEDVTSAQKNVAAAQAEVAPPALAGSLQNYQTALNICPARQLKTLKTWLILKAHQITPEEAIDMAILFRTQDKSKSSSAF